MYIIEVDTQLSVIYICDDSTSIPLVDYGVSCFYQRPVHKHFLDKSRGHRFSSIHFLGNIHIQSILSPRDCHIEQPAFLLYISISDRFLMRRYVLNSIHYEYI